MKTIARIAYAFLIGLSAAGCTQEYHEQGSWEESEDHTDGSLESVRFIISQEMTRSSIDADEESIDDVNIYAYKDGVLEEALYGGSDEDFVMTLKKGSTYNLYALANTGEVEAPSSEAELTGYRYSISSIDDMQGSFPMSWTREGYTLTGEDEGISVSLTRLVSRVSFSIDRSSLDEFSVTAVRLRQAALGVSPFSEGSRAESSSDVGDGDYASSSDLSSLNAGGEIVFYTLENCQGVLLPENDSPWSKVPSEIPDHSYLCTYLEMSASFRGEYEGVTVSSDNVKYRFYLGDDSCTDFSVKRNNDMSISLTLTEDRIFDESWKVSYGDDLPTVSYGLECSPASVLLSSDETAYLSAVYYKMVDGSRSSEQDVTQYAAWTTSDSDVVSVSGGKVTAEGPGSAVITATYNGYRCTAEVQVEDEEAYKVVLSRTSLSVQEGSTTSIKAYWYTYVNDVHTATMDITDYASWSSSSSAIASVSKGKVTGAAEGSATITASYSGYKATCAVTVTEKPVTYTYGLVVDIDQSSIYVGNTASATATYVTYADGVEYSREDVTADATWSTDSKYVATVSSGTVTGVSSGSATISASYDGYSDEVELDVQDRYTYTLTLSPSTLSLDIGESGTLSAIINTYINGQYDSSEDVTEDAFWGTSDETIASVRKGKVTGVAEGSAIITSSYNGAIKTASVSVASAPIITYELSVSLDRSSIETGDQAQATATYITYTYGTETSREDVTSSASWTSSDSDIASVSKGTVTGTGGGTASITASYNGYSDDVSIKVSDVYTYVLELSPTSLSLTEGETGSITARMSTYKNGSYNSRSTVTSRATWSTADASVASVSGGTVTAEGEGSTVITASFMGETATVDVDVTSAPVTSYALKVSLEDSSISYGETTGATATFITYTDGTETSREDVTSSASWSSSSSSVATVSSGTVTGKGGGTATITASYEGYSGSATISVSDVYTYSLSVSPTSLSIKVGGSGSLTATLTTYRNGSTSGTSDVTSSASWSSSSTSVATVSKGTVSGVTKGSSTVTASYDGLSAEADVTVESSTTYKLVVSLADSSIDYDESTSVTGMFVTYVDGEEVTSRDVTHITTWSSSSTSVATVSGSTVTGTGSGTTSINGVYAGYKGSASITVNDVFDYSLSLETPSLNMTVGDVMTMNAIYYVFRNGEEDSYRNVNNYATWSSSSSSIASVSQGTLTAKSAGSVTIRATFNGITEEQIITVTAAEKDLTGLSLSSDKTTYNCGEYAYFTATASYSDGTTADVTDECSWDYGDDCQVTSTPGVFIAGSSDQSGTFDITCDYTYNGQMKSAYKTCSVIYESDGISVSSSKVGWQGGSLTISIDDPYDKGWSFTSDDNHFTISGSASGTGSVTRTISCPLSYNGAEYYVYVTIGSETYSASIAQDDAPRTVNTVDYHCYATVTAIGNSGEDSGPGTASVYFHVSDAALRDMTIYDNFGNAYNVSKGSNYSETLTLEFDYMPYSDLVPNFIYGKSISPETVTVYDEANGIITYQYNYDY